MQTLKFDLNQKYGNIKILNATNGGPWHKRHSNDQWLTNFEDYKKARIPYSRNHDSNLSGNIYGGPYCHDISVIFPNFDADPYDPASYDFGCTDETILTTLDAGTKTFFRLGQTIEHQIVKHHLFPKDFNKWAIIAEHIIRHYTEGWANGFKLDMDYWEIWNEPDLDPENAKNPRCWSGTYAQFFDFFEIAAKHLKKCFPNIKIGGPAVSSYNKIFNEGFLKEMHNRNVPLDFFSWHIYTTDPQSVINLSESMRKLLDENGFNNTESILNEWNYVVDWEAQFKHSIKMIHGIKGAVFTMATISKAAYSSIDMLMYYDTRPSLFCGAFDYYTYEPLKGYYPLYWYGMFYDTESYVKCETDIKNFYTLCGVDKNGKALAVITHYAPDNNAVPENITVDFGKDGKYEIYMLDENHDGELIGTVTDLNFTMPSDSCILIKEI